MANLQFSRHNIAWSTHQTLGWGFLNKLKQKMDVYFSPPFNVLEPNPLHRYTEVSPIMANGTYSKISVDWIAATVTTFPNGLIKGRNGKHQAKAHWSFTSQSGFIGSSYGHWCWHTFSFAALVTWTYEAALCCIKSDHKSLPVVNSDNCSSGFWTGLFTSLWIVPPLLDMD